MNKKDVLEIKRRFKKSGCTFTRLCGCYVDSEKNTILNFGETFLNLEDDEFYKYLEIAKKTLSGTIGNNLLELEFPLDQEKPGGRQQFLMGLRESKLKNEDLLERFYQLIIDTYDYTGHFLILLFHDAYDVMTKTSDNSKLDESEEVYEYLLCAICPVSLTKPGLGYREDEHRIGVRERDWVVEAPEAGFVFPAFTDRSTDIHSVMYYTKNAKEPHPEFMEAGLGCESKQTATEQKESFQTIIRNALGVADEKENRIFLGIQQTLNSMVEEQEAIGNPDSAPIVLTTNVIQEVLNESGVSQEISAKIEESYTEQFGDTPPVVDHLIDSKALQVHAQIQREDELVNQVQTLTQKLEETKQIVALSVDEDADDMELEDASDILPEELVEEAEEAVTHPKFDVLLRVKPQKVSQIKAHMINGKKCLVIPLDEDEQANVNGVNTIL